MSEPHHYVFILLKQEIIRSVQIEAVLHHLIERKVVPASHISRYSDKPNNGMKILVGYLQNRSFEKFLEFVECILLAQGEDPSKAQSVTVVDWIVKALEKYDQRNDTCWVEYVAVIQQRYLKQQQVAIDRVLPSEEGQGVAEQVDDERKESSFREDFRGQIFLPDGLHYVEKPHQKSFRSEGGRFDSFEKHGFSVMVPPLAVCKGKETKLKVGLCCYGPFSISDKYLLAFDFAVVVAGDKFDRPVEILMDHCLILPEYRKCGEVVILRANCHRVTEEDNLYTFDQLTIPDILPCSPKVTFECTESGSILCVALRRSLPSSSSPKPHVTNYSPAGNDDSLSLVPSHFDNMQRTWGAESLPPPVQTVLSPMSSRFDSMVSSILQSRGSPSNVPTPQGMKTARNCQVAVSVPMEKYYGIEYAALLVQPKEDGHAPYHLHHFAVFICTNCSVAHKVCMEQAEKLLAEARKLAEPESESEMKLKSEPELELTIVPFVWRTAIRMDYSIDPGCVAWTVEPWRTPTLSLEEVQFHTMNREDRIRQKIYPPPVLFTAESDKGASPRFSCIVKLEGATMMETGGEVCLNIRT